MKKNRRSILTCHLLLFLAASSATFDANHKKDALEEDAEDAAAYARYMSATEASAQLMRLPVKSIYRSPYHVEAGRIVHVWSAWTVWSTCSRTCGGGITTRHRSCRKEYSRISPGSGIRSGNNIQGCTGESTEYAVCNPQHCPSTSYHPEDFRLFQCSMYNNKTIRGNVISSWSPYQSGTNQCELSCRAGTRAPALVHSFGKVLDGTRCTTDPEHPYKDFCINGRCLAVGCDGRVGSPSKYDVCGVCNGNNGTCVKVAALAFPDPEAFVLKARNPQRLTETYGYSALVRIPKGATHIRLSDNSTNYIALMDENKDYFLNGNWIIDWPGRFQSGTSSSPGVDADAFNYERIRDAETIRSRGPLQRDLIVMVLVREKDAGIYYEYWIPRHLQMNLSGSIDEAMKAEKSHQRIVSARLTSTTRAPSTTPSSIRRMSKTTSLPILKNATTTESSFWDDRFEAQPTAASLVRAQPKMMTYMRDVLADDAAAQSSLSATTRKPIKKASGPSKMSQVRQHIGLVHSNKNKHSKSVATVRSGAEIRHNNNELGIKQKSCSVDGSCWKTVNGKKHFCISEFVLRCRILNYETINGETRYEVQIVQSYKNMIPILSREFIWAEPVSKCPCPTPYLRTGTDYIIMGKTDRGFRRNEVRLLLDSDSYVRVYNQANADRVLRIRRDEAKYCQKFKTKFNLTT